MASQPRPKRTTVNKKLKDLAKGHSVSSLPLQFSQGQSPSFNYLVGKDNPTHVSSQLHSHVIYGPCVFKIMKVCDKQAILMKQVVLTSMRACLLFLRLCADSGFKWICNLRFI